MLKYRNIVNKNCHLVIKLLYYLGIIKVIELTDKYVIKIRFYHPLLIIFIILYYSYFIVKNIAKTLIGAIKTICNDLSNQDNNYITIYSKNDGK